jgi:outer membrane protein assembly factor BamB
VIWRSGLPSADDASYASMVAADLGGVKQYVQFLAKGLVGVNARTGESLWRYERTAKGTPAAIVTPLVSDGCVYSGAFRAGGGLVKPAKKGSGFEVEEIYFDNKMPFSAGGVVKVGDYFYGTTGQGLVCVNFKTGELKWEERAGVLGLIAADGRLYAHADKGDVILIEPNSGSYREISRFVPPGRAQEGNASAFAHPAIADGKLYIREANNLWCFDVKGE